MTDSKVDPGALVPALRAKEIADQIISHACCQDLTFSQSGILHDLIESALLAAPEAVTPDSGTIWLRAQRDTAEARLQESQQPLSDARVLELWRSVRGPYAELDGPLLVFAAKVRLNMLVLPEHERFATLLQTALDESAHEMQTEREAEGLAPEAVTRTENPTAAFHAWAERYVKMIGRRLSQDEFALAQAAFIAAHPGEGTHSSLMAVAGRGPAREERLEWAARLVYNRFVRDEADGYRSRDRQFAIEILGRVFDPPSAAASPRGGDTPQGRGVCVQCGHDTPHRTGEDRDVCEYSGCLCCAYYEPRSGDTR
jgi:hypothetical protein